MERTIPTGRRLLSIPILAVLVLSSIHLVPSASAEATYTTKLARTYGSYVSSAEPDANYHRPLLDYLVVAHSINASVGTKMAYLMFDLSGIPTGITVNSALLQARTFTVTEPHRIGIHYCEDDSWRGYSITWNNKPSFSAEVVEAIIVTKEDVLYNWTVTSCVQTALQGGWLSLVMKCEDPVPHGNHWVKLESIPILVINWTRIIRSVRYQPITPTPDDEVTVTSSLTNASAVSEVNLFYRVDGGEWSSRPMAYTGDSNYAATIPRQNGGAKVNLYVEVIDIFRNKATSDALFYDVRGLLLSWSTQSLTLILAVLAVVGVFGYLFIKKRGLPEPPPGAVGVDLILLVRRSFCVLWSNSILLAPALILSLVTMTTTITTLLMTTPVIGVVTVIVSFLISPYVLAGRGYMNRQLALGQKTSLEDFLQGGRKYFTKVLKGTILLMILLFLFSLPMTILYATFPSMASRACTGVECVLASAATAPSLPAFLLAFVLTVPWYVLTVAWLPAVILEEAGVVESFARSLGFVKRNIVSVLGYVGFEMLVNGPLTLLSLYFGFPSGVILPGQITLTSVGLWLANLVVSIPVTTFFTLLLFVLYMDRTRGPPVSAPPVQPTLSPQEPPAPVAPPGIRYCVYCGGTMHEDAVYRYHCGRMQKPLQ